MRLILLLLAVLVALPARADWARTLEAARGRTVWWHAWGGDVRTNAFIAWVGAEAERRHGVRIVHVRLTDTAEAVSRVIAERAAGRTGGGSVDLIWINGPNFLSMKAQGLLHGPFVSGLPKARFVDLSPGAAAALDFTVPVEGMESPRRLARLVFMHDAARAAFAALPTAPALPTLADLGPSLPEPHPGWMTRMAEDWARRMMR